VLPSPFKYFEGKSMSRILLLLKHQENCRLLATWLAADHEIVLPDAGMESDLACDLCIVDVPTLDCAQERIQQYKDAEKPVVLPVLLIAPRGDMGVATRHLWPCVDEVIAAPVEKAELQARIEILLRMRQLSLDLEQRNQDQETFIRAMTHDLRSPLQAIMGYAQLLEVGGKQLDAQERTYLDRIHWAIQSMNEMLTSLQDFCRMGRASFQTEEVPLQEVLETISGELKQEIQARNASITLSRPLPCVQADRTLVRMALTNLILNALKYVDPGTPPQVHVSATTAQGICCICVQDKGLGIAQEDQQRIFAPFVRLQRSPEYPGAGLGLAGVRKAVEMMGGHIGVESAFGEGSTFRIELPEAPQALSLG
jgi:signal transduction histidine kinase